MQWSPFCSTVQYSTNAHSLIDTMHLDSDPLHNLDHRPICFPSHNRYFDPCPVIYENDTEIEFVLLKPVKRRFRSSEIYMYQCTFPGNFSGRPTPVEIPKNTCFCSSEWIDLSLVSIVYSILCSHSVETQQSTTDKNMQKGWPNYDSYEMNYGAKSTLGRIFWKSSV